VDWHKDELKLELKKKRHELREYERSLRRKVMQREKLEDVEEDLHEVHGELKDCRDEHDRFDDGYHRRRRRDHTTDDYDCDDHKHHRHHRHHDDCGCDDRKKHHKRHGHHKHVHGCGCELCHKKCKDTPRRRKRVIQQQPVTVHIRSHQVIKSILPGQPMGQWVSMY
jgi:chromosome segregation ATPase